MTQNTQNKNFNNTYGEQHTYTANQNRTAARRTKHNNGRYTSSRATAVVLVLAIAIAVGSVTALVVSNFVKGGDSTNPAPASAVAVSIPQAVANNGNNNVQAAPANQSEQTANTAQNANAAQQLGAVTGIFSVTGKTSTGYDWNYSGDSNCAKINCQYDFGTHQYNFTAQGAYEGVDHVKLMYMTADNTWETQNVTVSVDKNLNVSVA